MTKDKNATGITGQVDAGVSQKIDPTCGNCKFIDETGYRCKKFKDVVSKFPYMFVVQSALTIHPEYKSHDCKYWKFSG